jgi:hypothetical protein
MDKPQIHEAVGAFRSEEAMEAAIGELASAGFDRADMSHLRLTQAPDPVSAKRLADDAGTPRSAIVSDTDVRQLRTLASGLTGVASAFLVGGITVLTGGGAALALAGAALAGGGAVAASAAVGKQLGDERHEALDAQAQMGGILLWVRLHAPGQDAHACEILRRHGAANVHVHDVPSTG